MNGSWGRAGMRCKIKPGWLGAGRQGDAFCFFTTEDDSTLWVCVKWDRKHDPELHKAQGLLIKHRTETTWEDGPEF